MAGNAFAGQSCISVQRVLVQASIVEQFTDALVAEVEGLVVGDPADERTDVSALINRGETDRVKSWIDEAVGQGAELRTGGDLTDTHVLRPTVLAGVRPEMEVCRTEVFGPFLGVQSFENFDDALRIANDSRYGLQAGVFTADLGRALEAARTLDFGGITVNEVPTWRADQHALRRAARLGQHPRGPGLHGAAR